MTKSPPQIAETTFALACILASSGALAADIPTGFAPNANVGWISVSGDWTRPPSGPGPVMQDPKVPHVSNEEFRRTGRQPTIAQSAIVLMIGVALRVQASREDDPGDVLIQQHVNVIGFADTLSGPGAQHWREPALG